MELDQSEDKIILLESQLNNVLDQSYQQLGSKKNHKEICYQRLNSLKQKQQELSHREQRVSEKEIFVSSQQVDSIIDTTKKLENLKQIIGQTIQFQFQKTGDFFKTKRLSNKDNSFALKFSDCEQSPIKLPNINKQERGRELVRFPLNDKKFLQYYQSLNKVNEKMVKMRMQSPIEIEKEFIKQIDLKKVKVYKKISDAMKQKEFSQQLKTESNIKQNPNIKKIQPPSNFQNKYSLNNSFRHNSPFLSDNKNNLLTKQNQQHVQNLQNNYDFLNFQPYQRSNRINTDNY